MAVSPWLPLPAELMAGSRTPDIRASGAAEVSIRAASILNKAKEVTLDILEDVGVESMALNPFEDTQGLAEKMTNDAVEGAWLLGRRVRVARESVAHK